MPAGRCAALTPGSPGACRGQWARDGPGRGLLGGLHCLVPIKGRSCSSGGCSFETAIKSDGGRGARGMLRAVPRRAAAAARGGVAGAAGRVQPQQQGREGQGLRSGSQGPDPCYCPSPLWSSCPLWPGPPAVRCRSFRRRQGLAPPPPLFPDIFSYLQQAICQW